MYLQTKKHLITFFLLATSLPFTFADCNNGEAQRCQAPGQGECVWKINGLCPSECVGPACFPDPDCINAAHQSCTFACCKFTDRPGCERCAEAAGMNAKVMCDTIGCQFQLSDLEGLKDTLAYVLPVITHD